MAESDFIFWLSFVALKAMVQSAPHSGSEVCEDWKLPRMSETEKYVSMGDSPYLWLYAEEANATAELQICCNGSERKYINISLKEANLYYLAAFDTENRLFSMGGETKETVPRARGFWLNSTSISYLKCSDNKYLPQTPVALKDIKGRKRIKKKANKWMISAFVLMGSLPVLFFALGAACGTLWRRKGEAQRAAATPRRPKNPQEHEAAPVYEEWNPSWSKTEEEHDSENSSYGV
ncbi:uncharacterized protein LOC125033532 [Penaeus chinensis]|uniref:uncharacterized protein LOC125033532 n=1 Tax=Penaeus chinensis TaxID=139456 RepID=UPI001FB67BD0|nr:uncharacterized protein LOC125033532 [Penaeus chinensis]